MGAYCCCDCGVAALPYGNEAPEFGVIDDMVFPFQ
jgi:hypothetical protein